MEAAAKTGGPLDIIAEDVTVSFDAFMYKL